MFNSELVSEKISKWIKDQVDNAKANGVVIGLSGGLDSSVVTALCVKAIGANNVHGLIMPCGSNSKDESLACDLAIKFNIPPKIIYLDDMFSDLSKTIGLYHDLPRSNLKSRLRMVCLRGVANEKNLLVAGTTNLPEYVLGYFTKDGDGACDFEPIRDLLKREVKELAIYLGVPQPIIDRPPSAGLWYGQTDEEEIGASYNFIDKWASGELYWGSSVEEQVLLNKLDEMHRTSQHKRIMPPHFKR